MAIVIDLVLLRVHDQLTIDGSVKGCQFDDFRFTVNTLYMCEPLYGYYVFVKIGAAVSVKEPRLKSCAAVSKHRQVCSFYIAPAYSTV